MSALPQEIIDRVIDELCYSTKKTDFTRVALTARSFLHRTQFHLFRSIDVDPSRSHCIIQNSQDWDAFHTILLKSPTIKFHIREIFFINIFYEEGYRLHDEVDHQISYPCPMHSINSKQDHIVTPRILKRFYRRTMSHISYVFLNLPCLRAVRLNDGLQFPQFPARDWRCIIATKGRQNVIIFCASISSITTLTLCHLREVPIDILDSILQLSQLTTLLINNVCLDDDVQWEQHTRKSYLTNLKVFGFMQQNYPHLRHSPSLMTKIAVLIFHSASQTLRKLIWCDNTGGHVDVRGLANLRVFSTNITGKIYESTLRPVLHEIIASQSQTIQVLELEMENNFRMNLDVASNYWTELDNLLADRSFSHLKEIRLLFGSFITKEDLAPPQSQAKRKYTGKYNWMLHAGVGVRGTQALQHDAPDLEFRFATEEAVSLFKSYALKASEKGVRITYGLTNGQDGLLSSNY